MGKKRSTRAKRKPQVTLGSGNVYADLELPDADQLLAKAELALQIRRLLDARCDTQKEAAALLRLHQPDISRLYRGELEEFSTDRLLTLLTRLAQHVETSIRPAKTRKEACIQVTA